MKKLLLIAVTIAFAPLAPVRVNAHCPLCTGGAAAAAAAAAYFGVRYGSIAVLLGGFSVALGLWLAHKPKKEYVEYQSKLLFWVIYLSTIIPFYAMFKGDYVSRYVSFGGDYGSFTNRTYLIDLFIIGSLLGSLIVYFAPRLSQALTEKRGKSFRFQGLLINFALLIIGGAIMQVWPR